MTSIAEVHHAPVANRGLITVSIMLATIMQALDTTIANVALPHMQGSLATAQDQITWVLTSYIVAAAIATPLTGWLTGRFGRKRMFLLAVFGFTVASALCGIAGSLGQMVLYRLLQGLFGAALVPLSQAVLLDINPHEKHGQAMAIWGAGIMVGPILGPTLGGWLTEDYNWRWVFYINLPIGALAFLGISIFVTETVKDRARPFDVFGFAMLSLGVGALQMMLDRGELKDWFGSTEIAIEAALAAIGFWVFLVHMLTAKHPFVSPSLFKDRNFSAGLVFIFVISIILYATLALLPPMMQGLMNYPVITTGALLAPRGIGTMVAMLAVGQLIGRIDIRLILAVGLGLTAFSLWQMTHYSLQMDSEPIVVAGIVQGVGLGFTFVPLSTVAFATLAPLVRTEAAAVFSLVRNMGGSIGISVVETMLDRTSQVSHADLAVNASPYNWALAAPQVRQIWDLHTTSGMAALNAEINRQAAMIGYVDDFELMMVITLAAIPLLLILRAPKRAARGPAAAAME
jgi:MFS transporter, DHA2 family, multidrug resistance protein